MEALSTAYGWTPDQVRGLDGEDFDAYISLLKGRSSVKKE